MVRSIAVMTSTSPAPLDRGSVTPLWAQVERDLRQRLAAGAFAERFPTDRELVEQYGVSRHTAREAVRRLHADGVLQRQAGRGSHLTPGALEQPLGALYSLFRTVESQGLAQRSEVLALGRCQDPEAASALGAAPEVELVHLARVRYADDEALAVDRVWLPAAIAAPLLDADFSRTALYDELSQRCGITPSGGTERIEPALPDPEDAARLSVTAMTPVLRVTRSGRTAERVVEFRRTIIRGDRYALVADWGTQAPRTLRAERQS